MRLGTFWLVRVGIVVILTGFVLCGMHAPTKNYVFPGSEKAAKSPCFIWQARRCWGLARGCCDGRRR